MTLDRVQSWYESVEADLRLRRGQAGKQLLEIAGHVGSSPYDLRRAVERLCPVLKNWISEGMAPEWAEKLYRQAKGHLSLLKLVPPVGDEVE